MVGIFPADRGNFAGGALINRVKKQNITQFSKKKSKFHHHDQVNIQNKNSVNPENSQNH